MSEQLLAVILVRDGQLLAAMSAARSQHAAAVLCGHSLAEAMLVHTTTVVRLECSFHLLFILIVYDALTMRNVQSIPFGLQNYSIFLKRQRNQRFFGFFLCVFYENVVTLHPLMRQQ